MSSIIAGAAKAAHATAASLLQVAQVSVGGLIKTGSSVSVKEGAPDKAVELDFTSKSIIVGVPGAFTPSCSSQVPGFISAFDKFKANGIKHVYVVSINDTFVVKAWKEKLAPEGTGVRFIADDKGAFTSSLGLIFDATPLLGSPRSKRYAIVAENNKVVSIAVEESPGTVSVTSAEKVLAALRQSKL